MEGLSRYLAFLVIDVAGHLQKVAKPDSIAISQTCIEPLQQRDGFNNAGREVDGFAIYEWSA